MPPARPTASTPTPTSPTSSSASPPIPQLNSTTSCPTSGVTLQPGDPSRRPRSIGYEARGESAAGHGRRSAARGEPQGENGLEAEDGERSSGVLEAKEDRRAGVRADQSGQRDAAVVEARAGGGAERVGVHLHDPQPAEALPSLRDCLRGGAGPWRRAQRRTPGWLAQTANTLLALRRGRRLH